jgi:hypothetical protein
LCNAEAAVEGRFRSFWICRQHLVANPSGRGAGSEEGAARTTSLRGIVWTAPSTTSAASARTRKSPIIADPPIGITTPGSWVAASFRRE